MSFLNMGTEIFKTIQYYQNNITLLHPTVYQKRGRRGERNINLLFYLFMQSLLDSCVHPDQGDQTCNLGIMEG